MDSPLSEDKIRRLLGLEQPKEPDIFKKPVDSIKGQYWWRPEDIDLEYQQTTKLRNERNYEKTKDKFFAPDEEFRFGPTRKMSPALKILGLSALTLLIVFLVFNGPAVFTRLKYWFVVDYRNQKWTQNSQESAVASAQDKLKIEKIGLNIPIFWQVSQAESLEKGKGGMMHLKDSPLFASDQPTVIYGLNSLPWWSAGEEVTKLSLLDKLVVGDQFVISFNKKEHEFTVSSINTYSAAETEYLPADTAFCIVTSAPTGTTFKRLVVCGK